MVCIKGTLSDSESDSECKQEISRNGDEVKVRVIGQMGRFQIQKLSNDSITGDEEHFTCLQL